MYLESFYITQTYSSLLAGFPSEKGNNFIKKLNYDKAVRIFGKYNIFCVKPQVHTRIENHFSDEIKIIDMPNYCFIGRYRISVDDAFTLIVYKNKCSPPDIKKVEKLFNNIIKEKFRD